MFFVDRCHQAGIGVILDWVPAHFPARRSWPGVFRRHRALRARRLAARRARSGAPRSSITDATKCAISLVANALFWADRYHVDGLRVDAVASMLYLDYSRKSGEWLPNRDGGRENLEAIDFLRQMNDAVHHAFPGFLTIAEESTSFAGVTRPPEYGGLGFNFKWNMGWMNDTLRYFAAQSRLPPLQPPAHHLFLRLRVVGELHPADIARRGGARQALAARQDARRRLAEAREFSPDARLYVRASRQKALVHGTRNSGNGRNGESTISSNGRSWETRSISGLRDCVRELNFLYRDHAQFHGSDCDHERISLGGPAQCRMRASGRFARRSVGHDPGAPIICVFNATPVPRDGYAIGVADSGAYRKIFDSDDIAIRRLGLQHAAGALRRGGSYAWE